MSEHYKHTGRHVFISYPRAHREIAEKVLRKIERARMNTWIDDVKIEPGTDDWERCIRDGVKDAYAVVLLCSPRSIESKYVQAEIVLAQKSDCPIIPIWIFGDNWVDCVPLSFVNFQYLDCRGDKLNDGVEKLVDNLHKIVAEGLPPHFVVETLADRPPGFIAILMTKNEGDKLDVDSLTLNGWRKRNRVGNNLQVIVANPQEYDSFEVLLDDIYTHYLHRRYPIYSYGCNWVIASPSDHGALFALPLEWLRYKRKRLLVDTVPDYRERSTPLKTFGLCSRPWAIIDSNFEVGFGFCTSDASIADSIFAKTSKNFTYTIRQLLMGVDSRDEPREVGAYDLDEVNPGDYKYQTLVKFYIDPGDESPDGKVIVVK